jgi:GNAT superfamily N-acetyltransferase
MKTQLLAWRIEEACLKAWPALHEQEQSGWLLRFANGLTRRANSANPLEAEISDPAKLISWCETFYYQRGLPTFFRIPSIINPDMQAALDARGYTIEGKCIVMHGDIKNISQQADVNVEMLSKPSTDWTNAMSLLQEHNREKGETYVRIVKSISAPSAYASLHNEGKSAALAYGTIYNEILCLESVVTEAKMRRFGYARRIVCALTDWAKSAGAKGVCLQVLANNQPALNFYTSIGLKELYQYHYWREPISDR